MSRNTTRITYIGVCHISELFPTLSQALGYDRYREDRRRRILQDI
jgi:hypothetical protein